MAKLNKKYIGGDFFADLKEEGIYEEVKDRAGKKILVYQILEEMKKQGLTKVAMAKRMATSRSELDRILNADNTAVSMESLEKAAKAVGKAIVHTLVNMS